MIFGRNIVIFVALFLLVISYFFDFLFKKIKDKPVWSVLVENKRKKLITLILMVLIIGLFVLKLSYGFYWRNYIVIVFFVILLTLIIYYFKFGNIFMALNFSKPFIQIVNGNLIEIAGEIKQYKDQIKLLGGKFSFLKLKWVIRFNTKEELSKYFDLLRNMGFAFESGDEINRPSIIFEELRQKGLLQGEFIEITWTYAGKYLSVVK